MDEVTGQQYSEIIKENLTNVVHSTFIPEFGFPFNGKVRDIYDRGNDLLMVTSDRISAFDIVHSRRIPFKGAVLNGLSLFGFKLSEDIIANALISAPDPYVQIQERLDNLGFEFVVRGYIWGSIAEAYESNVREIYGIKLPEGLLRYQKLDEPLFTPTTKAPRPYHDEPVTLEQMVNGFQAKYGWVDGLADKYGHDKATEIVQYVKDVSIRLYRRAHEHALSRGLIFVDTKYEFGIDKDGKIKLIDEANTPDSSRLVDLTEHREKWSIIASFMQEFSSKFSNVSKLLQEQPFLKITELSKEYVRDRLRELGYKKGDTILPMLSDDDVTETSLRYIETYERFTGQKFDFVRSELATGARLMNNLVKAGIAKGYCAIIGAGSDSDKEHIGKIVKSLEEYGIPYQVRIKSAHKQKDVIPIVEFYNESLEPLVWIAVASRTDALSGTVSYHSVHPVISCSPDGINMSCLNNPPGSPNATIVDPKNIGKYVAQTFSWIDPKLKKKIIELNEQKNKSLEEADKKAIAGELLN